MRVAVLGAGVIGVATAFELLRDGHEVVVVDRRAEPAAETSFANAGLICPGHAYAWSSPKALATLIKALWRDDLALRLRFQADPRFWRWGLKFAQQCTAARAATNTRHKVALCLYSLERLHAVTAETGIAYGGRAGGAFYIHRDPAELARADEEARILRDAGVEVRRVTPEEAAAIDPVYAPVRDRFAGALFVPGDESGDARLFTRNLARLCAERGADFRMEHSILRLETEDDRLHRVVTDKGVLEADAHVLALGCASAAIGRTVGLDLPIYPVKGYSVTLPITEASRPPTQPGIDEDHLFAFANYGDRVRLTGIAEFAGYDTGHRPADFATLLDAARTLFPEAGDYRRPEYWAGLRPMTPDNLPFLGRGRIANLWLNCGHGHLGWTWACGTARITADLVAGREPAHDPGRLLPR